MKITNTVMLLCAILVATAQVSYGKWPPQYNQEQKEVLRSAKSVGVLVELVEGESYFGWSDLDLVVLASELLGNHGVRVFESDSSTHQRDTTLKVKVEATRFTKGPPTIGIPGSAEEALARATIRNIGGAVGALMGEDTWEGTGTNIKTEVSLHVSDRRVLKQKIGIGYRTTDTTELHHHLAQVFTNNMMGLIHQAFGIDAVIDRLGGGGERDYAEDIQIGAREYLWDCVRKKKSVQRDSLPVETLLFLLRDDNPNTRSVVAELLGLSGDNRAFGPLIDVLKDSSLSVQRHARHALKQSKKALKNNPVPVDTLIVFLQDDYWEKRKMSAEQLGKSQEVRAVDPLIDALRDENKDTRKAARKALKKITGKDFGEDIEKWELWREEEAQFQ